MQILANELGASSSSYLEIEAFVQNIAAAINAGDGTPPPNAVTVSSFAASARGEAIVAAIESPVTFVSGSGFMLGSAGNYINPSISNDQAHAITTMAENAREARLDLLVQSYGGDPASLSIAERAVLLDVLYQYGEGSNKVKTAVNDFFNGDAIGLFPAGDDLGLLIDVTNPKYGARGKNDEALLFPNDSAGTSVATGQAPTPYSELQRTIWQKIGDFFISPNQRGQLRISF